MKGTIAIALLLAATVARGEVVIDRAALEAAIDRELRGVAHGGDIQVNVHDDGTATVTFRRSDGAVLRRTVTLPPRPEEAVETLALLAGNLARDQEGELVRGLTPPPPPAPAPIYPERGFGFGLVQPLSSDLIYGPVAYQFAFHLIGGYTLGTSKLSLSGVADVQKLHTGGVQIAGAAAIALGDVDGVQMSGGANVAVGRIDGVQLSPVNYAGAVNGLQLGVINVAGHARGLQLGVINYADTQDDVSIGVISIVRHGILEVDAWGESFGGLAVALRHGTRRFYNLYGAASGVPGDDGVQMFGLGFGTRFGGDVEIDLSAMCWDVEGPSLASDLSLLNQARLTVAIPLGRFALFGGAGSTSW